MEYQRTKDINHVTRLMGQEYQQHPDLHPLGDFGSEEYVSKVARGVKEACELVELASITSATRTALRYSGSPSEPS